MGKRNSVKRTGSGDKHTDGKTLGEYRTQVACKALSNLAKVGNRASYELTDAEKDQIMDALSAEMIGVEAALRKGYVASVKTFRLK